MATDLLYPTNAELTQIAQDRLPRLVEQRPVFRFFPITTPDAALVMWEQIDNYKGLQQVRGLNGQPPKVIKTGGKRYQMQPGVYGEYEPIDETEMTLRRQWGSYNAPVDITDLVLETQKKLLVRRLDRVEWIIWTLLATGTFSVTGPAGAILHTDSYTMQTFSAAVSWGTPATATPLADFRSVQILGRGHSVNFGAAAEAWMNRVTYNKMIANTNNADLYGRRTAGLGTINSVSQFNQILQADDLPQIVIYDEGYLTDANGTFTPFLADNTVIVVGKRADNAPVGEFQMTRNANNPGMAAGAYMKVIDNGDRQVPREVQVHDGFNGGPAIKFPSAVVRMNV
ncbi:MAG: major capsid protein [Thermomicrobiales bacterium]